MPTAPEGEHDDSFLISDYINHTFVFPTLKTTVFTMAGGCGPSASFENKPPRMTQVNMQSHAIQEEIRVIPSKFKREEKATYT